MPIRDRVVASKAMPMPSADWFKKRAVLLGKMQKNKSLKIAERAVVAQFGQRRKNSPCWLWAQIGVNQQVGRVTPRAPPSVVERNH